MTVHDGVTTANLTAHLRRRGERDADVAIWRVTVKLTDEAKPLEIKGSEK